MGRETERIKQHRAAVVSELRKRLEKLEIQVAQMGPNTPPITLIEIDDIKAQIEELTPEHQSAISAETAEDLGPVGRYQVLMSHVQTLYAKDYALEKALEKLDWHVQRLTYVVIAGVVVIVLALRLG